MSAYDLVMRGSTVASAPDTFAADIANQGGSIAAIGRGRCRRPRDRRHRPPRPPGGVDGHCHIEQLSASGLMNADTFETATGSAALGGTTTVIPFAAQHVGMSLRKVVDDYTRRPSAAPSSTTPST